MLENWSAEALNTAPNSQNEIHGDRIAQEFGFEGGLVPGVTISAYLVHPAILQWGVKWLERGTAQVKVSSPLYDGERFEVSMRETSERSFEADLWRPNGVKSATATVGVPDHLPAAPIRRQDPIAEPDFRGPAATFEVWRELKASGCKAFRYYWDGGDGELKIYLRDQAALPALLQPEDGGFANMSFLLGCSNWILASNAYMNPWVHLETRSQNFSPVPRNTHVIAEMQVLDYFEKKGHQFIDVDVDLYDERSGTCYMTTMLRAIFRLRGA